MTSEINDLPTTSPHGSDFHHYAQFLGLISNPIAAPGTTTAHRHVFWEPVDKAYARSDLWPSAAPDVSDTPV
jgi:hypothetical protein